MFPTRFSVFIIVLNLLLIAPNSFQNELDKSFSNDLQEERLSNIGDVLIQIGKHQFVAHKLILKRLSPVLKRMLSSTSESSTPRSSTSKPLTSRTTRVELPAEWVDPKVMEDLLTFFYVKELSLTTGNARALCLAAHYLNNQELLNKTKQFLSDNLSTKNVVQTLVLSKRLTSNDLYDESSTFAIDSKEAVLYDIRFLENSYEDLTTVLQIVIPGIHWVNIKQKTLEFLMKWLKHSDKKELHQRLPVLWSFIESVPEPGFFQEFRKQFFSPQDGICKSNSFCIKVLTKSFDNAMKMVKKRSVPEKDSENFMQKKKVTKSDRKSAPKSVPTRVAAPKTTKLSKKFGNSHIYCFYGTEESTAYSRAMSHFDCKTANWTIKKWMTTIPRAYVAGATIGSRIYLFGGMAHGHDKRKTAEVFDAIDETLEPLEPLPEGRNNAAAAVLNGSIYLTGGWAPADKGINVDVLRYSVENNEWETLPHEMNQLRAAHQLVELDGKLYAIGGVNQVSAEVYDPTTESWSVISALNFGHSWGSAVVHEKKIYVLSSKGFEVYSPENETWTALSHLNNLFGTALVSVDGKLLAMGGAVEYKGLKNMHSYDIENDVWTQEADMKDGRAYHYCGVVES